MENCSGTYALILENTKPRDICVGKLGRISFPPGGYVYTGSAFGPGGLASRVGRHFKQEKKCRWHIDYLSTRMAVTRVWYTTSPVKLECQWAQHFFDLGGSLPAKGFGASDCRCNSHLLFFPGCPCLSDFQELAGACFPDADKNRIKALNKTHFRAG
jgi:Uri superfamily endonuclease